MPEHQSKGLEAAVSFDNTRTPILEQSYALRLTESTGLKPDYLARARRPLLLLSFFFWQAFLSFFTSVSILLFTHLNTFF